MKILVSIACLMLSLSALANNSVTIVNDDGQGNQLPQQTQQISIEKLELLMLNELAICSYNSRMEELNYDPTIQEQLQEDQNGRCYDEMKNVTSSNRFSLEEIVSVIKSGINKAEQDKIDSNKNKDVSFEVIFESLRGDEIKELGGNTQQIGQQQGPSSHPPQREVKSPQKERFL